MRIILTKHSVDRAKERFSLSKQALEKLFIKCLQCDNKIIERDKNVFYKNYSHYSLVIERLEKGYKLITIINSHTTRKYKRSKLKPIYLKGKKVGILKRIKKK